jgi:hypothetical protein
MVSVQEAEEKRKRLEEAEKKRQAMMQGWGSCLGHDMMQEPYIGHALCQTKAIPVLCKCLT